VYGGGGIVPDVFVPMEAEHGNENVAYLLQTGIVGHFVFEELDKNRDAFKGAHFNEFLAQMKSSDDYFKKFKKYISLTGLDLKLDKTKALVNRYITAEFARQLYGEMYYYDVILKEDAMIKTILNPKK
ncbi:MAG: peptidase S41, partial [Flavobacterium sp.]